MAANDRRIPVHVITGFLGSGKTTLLKRILASPRFENTAVLVNELGAVDIDALLIRAVDETTVLLSSGCVCCTIRADLRAALVELLDKRDRGAVPAFARIAVETTGLADPAPVAFTLAADPALRHRLRLGSIVATVDAVNGARHLARHRESAKQAAVADRLVLTKTDLADARSAAVLRARLGRLNPSAPLDEAALPSFRPQRLFSNGRLRAGGAGGGAPGGTPGASGHDRRIRAISLAFDEPLDWTAFGLWLTMLLNAHGADVLRVKGILNVKGSETPVAINGVQHLVHPPAHLERWPDADHRSRIVFIVHGMDRRLLERSLAAFHRLANRREELAFPRAGPSRRRALVV
ncbi:MAG: CobW family GTP-binding protein [Pseudomonadota bacterium]